MKGLRYSLARMPQVLRDVTVARISVDTTLAFTGSVGVAVGDAVSLASIPEGNVLLLGAVANLTFTGPGSADLADDFQGDYSIGTVATEDADVADAGEANILASAAIPAATAEVSANVRSTNATQAIIDNTEGGALLALNVLLDADEVADGEEVEVVVTGTVHVAYIMLGDD